MPNQLANQIQGRQSAGFLQASWRRETGLNAAGGQWCLGLTGKLERVAWH